MFLLYVLFFFFKQKTAYEMRISDWSSDVCSSDLDREQRALIRQHRVEEERVGEAGQEGDDGPGGDQRGDQDPGDRPEEKADQDLPADQQQQGDRKSVA